MRKDKTVMQVTAANNLPRVPNNEPGKKRGRPKKTVIAEGVESTLPTPEDFEAEEEKLTAEESARIKRQGFIFTDELLRASTPTKEQSTKAREYLGEEDFELFWAIRFGTPKERIEARRDLVVRHTALVWWLILREPFYGIISNRKWDCALDFEDLAQEAISFGLTKAIEKFDYTREGKFSTYAYYWIYQAAHRCIDNAGVIRVPVHMIEKYRKYQEVRTQIAWLQSGEWASPSQLQTALEMSEEEFVQLQHAATIIDGRGLSWLFKGMNWRVNHKNSRSRADTYQTMLEIALDGAEESEKNTAEQVSDAIDFRQLQVKLSEFLRETDVLVEAERFVLTWRFGLNGEASETLEQVGERIGLTRERIRQIEAKAVEKLRNSKLWENVALPYWSEVTGIAHETSMVESASLLFLAKVRGAT